jgi:hypothetical protein
MAKTMISSCSQRLYQWIIGTVGWYAVDVMADRVLQVLTQQRA